MLGKNYPPWWYCFTLQLAEMSMFLVHQCVASFFVMTGKCIQKFFNQLQN